MKIISADASPFARKVRVAVLELGLQDRVEVVSPGAVTPVSNNELLNAANPLGMIPVLIKDDGSSLLDSPVICEYLNHQAKGALYPQDDTQFEVLSLHAMADGLLDVAVALRYETALRPEQLRWADWIETQEEKLHRTFDHFEQCCDAMLSGKVNIASIAVACALAYIDFRFEHLNWRDGRPTLDAWNTVMQERPSFKTTTPA